MPESVVDTDQYYLRIHSSCFQKSCFLVAEADSGGNVAVVVVGAGGGVVAVAVAAAADPMTRRGMNRRVVVGYNRSVGGIGR